MHLDQSSGLYQELQLQPFNLTYQFAQSPENVTFNRDHYHLPPDLRLVSKCGAKNTEVDYLNAIFLDVENEKNCIIATEHPLSLTLYRLWNTILTKKCSILMLIHDIEFSSVSK